MKLIKGAFPTGTFKENKTKILCTIWPNQFPLQSSQLLESRISGISQFSDGE